MRRLTEAKIEPSCGCVFCDVGLEPDLWDAETGKPFHNSTTGDARWAIECSRIDRQEKAGADG